MAYPAILRPYFKILRPYFSITLPYSAIKGTIFYQNQWFLELFLAKNAFCCHTFICCHSTANALYKGFPNDVWQCGSKFPKTKKSKPHAYRSLHSSISLQNNKKMCSNCLEHIYQLFNPRCQSCRITTSVPYINNPNSCFGNMINKTIILINRN